MPRILLIVTLCFLIMASGTGCWDSREIDDWAYVYAIGVDKGVADKIRFSILIPTYKGPIGGASSSGGSTGPSKSDFKVISIDCPTLYAGVNLINCALARTLNYTHAKYMVVSEDIAKEGVGPFVNGMRRTRQIRRIMHFIVVRGEASKFLDELSPTIGTAVSKSLESMMNQEGMTGLFDDTTFGDIINSMKSTKGQTSCVLGALNDLSHYLPEGSKPPKIIPSGDYYAGELPIRGVDKPEYLGSVLFRGDKLVGELNGDETRVMLMARGEFNRGTMALPDPQKPDMMVALDVSQQKKPDVRITFKDGVPLIHLKVFLEANMTNLQSDVNYENEKLKPVLEGVYKEYIKKKLDETIAKCQRVDSDVFRFGDQASMQFLTIQEWEKYDWLSQFKEAQITTAVGFTIRRTGTVLKTNPTIKGQEME
ncbi:MAG: Ger(x)C family spore germination protein [Acidobacteriota bacterium]